nr:unnamed protein product [Callosobruchus analis]
MSSEQLNGPTTEHSPHSIVKDDTVPKETESYSRSHLFIISLTLDHLTTFRSQAQLQRQHSSDKPPPPGASPSAAFLQSQQQQQRPLLRTDSRVGFQPRIPFQSPQVRPQVRQPFAPPGGGASPVQPFAPRQPPRPVQRPQTPFPRQPGPGPGNHQTQKIFQQRSVPAFGRSHIPEEGVNRSQTLDSAELEYSRYPPDDNRNTSGVDYGSKTPSIAAINNRSYSLSSNAPENQIEAKEEARRRSTSSVDSLGDSGDNLEKKNEEVPSRPTSRMNRIVEDEYGQQGGFQRNFTRNGYEDHNTSRPESRSSSRLGKEDELQLKQVSKTDVSPNSSRPQSRAESRLSKKDEEKPRKSAEPPSRPESRASLRGGKIEDVNQHHRNDVIKGDQIVTPSTTRHLDLGKPPKPKSPARKGIDDEKLLQCLDLSDLSDCYDTSEDECEDFIEPDEHDIDDPAFDRYVRELVLENDSDNEPLSELKKKLLQQKSLSDGKHLSWTKMGCFVPPGFNFPAPEETAYERRD